jgi:hypothetical protein
LPDVRGLSLPLEHKAERGLLAVNGVPAKSIDAVG